MEKKREKKNKNSYSTLPVLHAMSLQNSFGVIHINQLWADNVAQQQSKHTLQGYCLMNNRGDVKIGENLHSQHASHAHVIVVVVGTAGGAFFFLCVLHRTRIIISKAKLYDFFFHHSIGVRTLVMRSFLSTANTTTTTVVLWISLMTVLLIHIYGSND